MKYFARIDGIGKGKIKKCLICCLAFAMCLFMALERPQTAEASAQKKSTSQAQKTATKKASGKKATAKKSTAKKSSSKKTSAKKASPKKSTAKKSTPKKSAAKKKNARKAPARSKTDNMAEQPTNESRLSLYQRGIYSAYGWRNIGRRGSRLHKGVDISAPSGADIVAFAPGEVILAGRDKLYGICVMIRQDDGVTARYAHMSSTHLDAGERVALGEEVGKIGRTGRATGSHLHFELITEEGKFLNPANYLVDGRQLVAAAHVAPGALAYSPQTHPRQPLAVATVEAAKKFTESSRLGLMDNIPKQVQNLP